MSWSILKQMAEVDKKGVRMVGLGEGILCQRVGWARRDKHVVKTRVGCMGK